MGPSSLQARELCPGSRRMIEAIPGRGEDESSQYAKDGTKGHELIAAVLEGKMSEETAQEVATGKGMWDSVHFCLQHAFDLRRKWKQYDPVELVEHRVDLTKLDEAVGFGTLDFGIVVPFNTAVVVDFKLGHGEVPAARQNLQLVTYALGIQDEYEVEQVHGIILEGGRGFISEYTYTKDVLDNARKHIKTVVDNSSQPWAPLVPGPDQCKYCPALTTCPALQQLAGEVPTEMDPAKISPDDIAKFLELREMLDQWLKKIWSRATALALAGADIPGWGLKDGRPKRAWKSGITAAKLKALAKKLKKPQKGIVVTELANPPALEKAWGKAKAVREALDELIVSKPGEQKLGRIKTKKEA